MNEAETRAELIDPKLKACGWGVVEGSKILREYHITAGKIQTGGVRAKKLTADYILVYKGIKLAVIEAKSDQQGVGEGVAQAKQYAEKLSLETTYSTNGKEIYSICMKSGAEGLVANYLTPEELWDKTYPPATSPVAELVEAWREKFSSIPFEDIGGTKGTRYYQEIAINNTLEAIANNKNRILLTLATGTGKTFIAFQVAWKLFQSRWNLKRDSSRRPLRSAAVIPAGSLPMPNISTPRCRARFSSRKWRGLNKRRSITSARAGAARSSAAASYALGTLTTSSSARSTSLHGFPASFASRERTTTRRRVEDGPLSLMRCAAPST